MNRLQCRVHGRIAIMMGQSSRFWPKTRRKPIWVASSYQEEPHLWLDEARNLQAVVRMEQYLRATTRYRLMGVNLLRKPTHWLAVLRIGTDRGANFVSFVTGQSLRKLIWTLGDLIIHQNMTWKPDKWQNGGIRVKR